MSTDVIVLLKQDPRVRELLPDLEDDILESYEEHHVAECSSSSRRR